MRHPSHDPDPPPAQRQDRRHPRPRIRHLRDDPRPVSGRRRRVPAEHEPRNPRGHRPASQADPRGREGGRPPDLHSRRPAGAEAALRYLRQRLGDAERRRQVPLRSRSEGRRRHPGLPAASGDFRGPQDWLDAAGQRRQDPAEGDRLLGRACPNRGRGRRRDLEPQGRERARRGAAAGRALAEGPQGSRVHLRAGCRLAGAELRAARHRRVRGARAGRRARGDPVEDREAGGGDGVLRDPRRLRRHHGGPRRSRRRVAGAAAAADPEAADPRLPRRRQAGDRRDADAGEHDLEPGADPRRGVGRRDSDLRRGPTR